MVVSAFVNHFRLIEREFRKRRGAMYPESEARAVAYQVLDQLLSQKSVMPGLRGAMFAVVDSLRGSSAPVEDIRCAEKISIGIQKFEWARQLSDETASAAALDELRNVAVSWLDTRIRGSASRSQPLPC
jgi:hypothetical protein